MIPTLWDGLDKRGATLSVHEFLHIFRPESLKLRPFLEDLSQRSLLQSAVSYFPRQNCYFVATLKPPATTKKVQYLQLNMLGNKKGIY